MLGQDNCRLGSFGLFDLLFVLRSFLGVRPPTNIKKSDITIFGLVLYFNERFGLGAAVNPFIHFQM